MIGSDAEKLFREGELHSERRESTTPYLELTFANLWRNELDDTAREQGATEVEDILRRAVANKKGLAP